MQSYWTPETNNMYIRIQHPTHNVTDKNWKWNERKICVKKWISMSNDYHTINSGFFFFVFFYFFEKTKKSNTLRFEHYVTNIKILLKYFKSSSKIIWSIGCWLNEEDENNIKKKTTSNENLTINKQHFCHML